MRSVLQAYYEAHPEFIVEDGEMVKPVEPLDYRAELALNEAILVDVLRSSPACVLDRASVATECIRRSMNVNTFSIYLSYSPVVVHLGKDVWSLRGVRVDPAAVEAVREANALREKEKRVHQRASSGWLRGYRRRTMPPIWSSVFRGQSGITLPDGSLTQGTRITSAMDRSG
jgi:hypothetical protein